MKKKRSQRNIVPLAENLERRLSVYALAATAAGVGVLALAPSAKAGDITVVTPSPQFTVGPNGSATLSVNGSPDFKITASNSKFASGTSGNLFLRGLSNNQAAFVGFNNITSGNEALLLSKGESIGPSAGFGTFATLAGNRHLTTNQEDVFGNWANKSGYLGFKFFEGSKSYFGWAHLKVTANVNNGETATISEFAYDTCAGQTIEAGQTTGGPCSPTSAPEPGTLSLLALGAVGLFALRKKRQVEAEREPAA